jgi:hypothetical protein
MPENRKVAQIHILIEQCCQYVVAAQIEAFHPETIIRLRRGYDQPGVRHSRLRSSVERLARDNNL